MSAKYDPSRTPEYIAQRLAEREALLASGRRNLAAKSAAAAAQKARDEELIRLCRERGIVQELEAREAAKIKKQKEDADFARYQEICMEAAQEADARQHWPKMIGPKPYVSVDYSAWRDQLHAQRGYTYDEKKMMTLVLMGRYKAFKAAKKVTTRHKSVKTDMIEALFALASIFQIGRTENGYARTRVSEGCQSGDLVRMSHKMLQDKMGDIATDYVRKTILRYAEKEGLITRHYHYRQNKDGTIKGREVWLHWHQYRWESMLQQAHDLIKLDTVGSRKLKSKSIREGGRPTGSLRSNSYLGSTSVNASLSMVQPNGENSPDKKSYHCQGSPVAEALPGEVDSDQGSGRRLLGPSARFGERGVSIKLEDQSNRVAPLPAQGLTASSDEVASATSFPPNTPGSTPVVPPAPLLNVPKEEWLKYNSGRLPGHVKRITTDATPSSQEAMDVWVTLDTTMREVDYKFSNNTFRIISKLQAADAEQKRQGGVCFYPETYTVKNLIWLDKHFPAIPEKFIDDFLAIRDGRSCTNDVREKWEFRITELPALINNFNQITLLMERELQVEQITSATVESPIARAWRIREEYPTWTRVQQAQRAELYAECVQLTKSAAAMLDDRFRQYHELDSSRKAYDA